MDKSLLRPVRGPMFAKCMGDVKHVIPGDLLNDAATSLAGDRQYRALEGAALECELLRAAIEHIDAHATPLGTNDDGFVTTGYLVSVGAMHRALGVARQGSARRQVSPTPSRNTGNKVDT